MVSCASEAHKTPLWTASQAWVSVLWLTLCFITSWSTDSLPVLKLLPQAQSLTVLFWGTQPACLLPHPSWRTQKSQKQPLAWDWPWKWNGLPFSHQCMKERICIEGKNAKWILPENEQKSKKGWACSPNGRALYYVGNHPRAGKDARAVVEGEPVG